MRVHGHRGARGIRPENTMEAFEYAIAVGVDAIEMDVVVTRDDVPVVHHDPQLPGGIRIRTLSRADLPPSIPSLAEVLALPGHFNIEVKSYHDGPSPDALAALVLQEIDRCGVRARSMVQSFDFRVLHAMYCLAPEIPRGALFERGGDLVPAAYEGSASITVPEFHLVTARNVRAAHAAGLEVFTWTPNEPEDWRMLIDLGVDAIITDDPERLLQMIRATNEHE